MRNEKITAPALSARKGVGPKIAAVTAYDASMARLLDEAGVDIILVGDSLGMVVQGLTNTLPVTLDEVCYHGRAVARGVSRAHVVGDLPFMSFQVSAEKALEAAGKLLKEGAVEAVKIEGTEIMAEHARRIVQAGIPVMGHVGLAPQSVHAMGGFRVQGRTHEGAERVLNDALAMQAAGVYCVVLEGLPTDLAQRITAALSIPTIGIGAGPHCDGQILVSHDFLGLFRGFRPKFVKQFADLGGALVSATQAYVREVRAGTFPGVEHGFSSSPAQLTSAQAASTGPALSGDGSRSTTESSRGAVDGSAPPPSYGPEDAS